MDDIDGLDALESEAKALEQTLGSVTVMTNPPASVHAP